MYKVLIATLFLFLCNCGVKGDPQPPVQAPFLGRGRPTYDQATLELIEKDKEKKREEENQQKKRQ